MHVRFDRDPTPEETRLPNRLPEGLEGIGMGLGSGGKPLTDVLKSIQQISENTAAEKPDPGLSSAKTLAELTPALALLAQQMNLAASVTQTPALNQLGSGVFSNLNPGANILQGFNSPMPAQAAPQPQAQVAPGFGANLASAAFGGQQGFGNITGTNMNLGLGQTGMNTMNQNLPNIGINGAQNQLGPANNAAAFALRNPSGATMDRSRAPPPVISRNPLPDMAMDRRQDTSNRYSPGTVPAPYNGKHTNSLP